MGKYTEDDGEEEKIDIEELNEEEKIEKEKEPKKGKISKMGLICRLVLLIASGYFIYEIQKADIVPFKYLAIGIAVLVILNLIFLIILLKNRKNTIIKIISGILALTISSIFVFGALKVKQGNDLLSNMNIKYKTLNFSVIVRADSKYESLDDLSGESMGYFKNDAEGMKESIAEIEGKNDKITLAAYENLSEMGKDLLNNEIDSILIEDGYKSILQDPEASANEENNKESEEEKPVVGEKIPKADKNEDNTILEDFEEQVRVIYTFTINMDLVETVKDVVVTEKPFNIYISGIDTYGNIASVSRSDVNIVATVNPSTKQVLLTSIPRDYYVQLHGTTGYRDKLTHAGIYGIDKSLSTIEDLLDIEINYYFKFNFTSVIDIVNAIGGVEVYSDYTFQSVKGFNYTKGYNKVNGKQALSFVRERKAFHEGDRQRGKNQQAMIDAIAHKCMSPKILTQYNSLLKSLQKTFVTNMPPERMKSLVKMQLDTGSDWTITTNSLTGTDSKQYTYSYSGAPLYVMVPSESSIQNAKDLINQVANGKKLDASFKTSDGSDVHSVTKSDVPKKPKKVKPKTNNKKDNKNDDKNNKVNTNTTNTTDDDNRDNNDNTTQNKPDTNTTKPEKPDTNTTKPEKPDTNTTKPDPKPEEPEKPDTNTTKPDPKPEEPDKPSTENE